MDLTRVRWRKASYSGNNGNCVEVGTWRKASHSGSNGNCVEVAGSRPDAVAVRDSKDPRGPVLVFTPGEWKAFTDRLKVGPGA
jgi:hypothetical protein